PWRGYPYSPPLPVPLPYPLAPPNLISKVGLKIAAYSIRTVLLLNHSWRRTRRKWKAPMHDHHLLSTNHEDSAAQSVSHPAPEPSGSPRPSWLPQVDPWTEPVDGSLLLLDLARALTSFLILPKWAPETIALFTIHTYGYHLRDVTAYLGIESP